MNLIFSKIKVSDHEAYITAKLELWTKEILTESLEFDLSASVKLLTTAHENQDSKILAISSSEIPTVAPEHASEVEARKKCALQQVADRSPLLPHETLESDEFTFLQAPLGHIPEATPFLRRTTNLAELFYFFPDFRVEAAQARLVPVDQAPREDPATTGEALAASGSGDKVTSLAIDLANGLLKWVGLSMLSSIFPEQVPGYFQEVYAELRKIVHVEVTANTIGTITGSINGIATWSKYDYDQMKQQGEKPGVLLGLLRDQSKNFHTQIQTLMVPRFSMPGIQVFLVAGSLHLFLYQEMALVSTEQKTLQGVSTSSDAPTGIVELYAKHAESTFTAIGKIRSKLVEKRYDPIISDYPAVVKDRYFWIDTYTGKRSKIFEDWQDKNKKWHMGEPDLEKSRNAYLKKVLDELNRTLGDPLGTAKKWREADKKPA